MDPTLNNLLVLDGWMFLIDVLPALIVLGLGLAFIAYTFRKADEFSASLGRHFNATMDPLVYKVGSATRRALTYFWSRARDRFVKRK